MVLYHATTEENAASILREGFRDGCGISLRGIERGVWLSDVPERIELARELINDEALDYREFLLPAKLAHRYAIVLMSEAA